ncbi:transmembrane and immunoglobulin domain-containing protein 2 isoform X2 [Corvus moneduloides]|uniref:transmembrane and immunoglobulin domain-containing protein 2 isoform X2 n=1 Tax=Corvus moneduloides TaxID=1196302 RepID=UPI0013620D12|nr:transmembrane and immunoglobulin domain-containing protein 2 isoform X2 [Corvus moneduloides]
MAGPMTWQVGRKPRCHSELAREASGTAALWGQGQHRDWDPLGTQPLGGGSWAGPGGGMWGLGVLIPLLGASALRVIQAPGEAQVTAGDAVALWCQVEEAESGALLRMEWVRDGGLGVLCATRLDFVTPLPLSPCSAHAPGVQLAWHPPQATLSLPQVQGNDSGRYLCRVTLEIPRYGTATGSGTELSVAPGTGGWHRGEGGRWHRRGACGVTDRVDGVPWRRFLGGFGVAAVRRGRHRDISDCFPLTAAAVGGHQAGNCGCPRCPLHRGGGCVRCPRCQGDRGWLCLQRCSGGSWGAWGALPFSWGWPCSATAAVTGAQGPGGQR